MGTHIFNNYHRPQPLAEAELANLIVSFECDCAGSSTPPQTIFTPIVKPGTQGLL